MQKIMENKGITLVALVVSIIIMLILAGVTLNVALGQNGLFKMSEKAVEKYKEAQEEEENALQKGSEGIANVIESLKPPVVIDGGKVADNIKEYQGKYVDIGLDVIGTTATTDDWEIFYAGNGRIFLIASDYVPTETLEKDWGVIGSNTKLDGGGFKKDDTYQYNVRWPNAPTSFFDKLPNLSLVMHTGYDLNANNGKTNSIATSQLLDTEAWSGIKSKASKKDCIDFVIGGPTLEMWCAAWNEAVEGDTNGFVEIKPKETNANGYLVSSDLPEMQNKPYLCMTGTTGTQTSLGDKLTVLGQQYKTFFPHTSSFNNCYGYWLASPCADATSYLLYVDGGTVGDAYNSRDDYGVRPVVCLQDGVKLTETAKDSGIYNISK